LSEESRERPIALLEMEDPETRELQIEQVQRELRERERAGEADRPSDARTHERRADKHEYLREKLSERARSEDENA
jgi:hypothetical protein